jgi:hypothetical protein
MLEPSRTGNSTLAARLLRIPNQSLVFVVFFAITAATAPRKGRAVREPPLQSQLQRQPQSSEKLLFRGFVFCGKLPPHGGTAQVRGPSLN